MSATILVVDDDASLRRAVRDRVAHWGHVVEDVGDGAAALAAVDRREFDLVILDLWMPGMSGLEVLARLRKTAPDTDVLVLTAHGSVDVAVEAIRAGATDFLQKPAEFDLLRTRIDAILERRGGRRFAEHVAEGRDGAVGGLVAAAPSMRALLATAAKAAQSDAVVLLTGESGVGKQVVAEAIHAASRRRAGPFVYVNCVALSDDLVESTLFGHEKGAFTGAIARKPGRLEMAQGGTALLDEIGDTSERFQTKLLHFLETGEYERVGGTKTLRADCRIVAATNKDLKRAVEVGTFRADLYYRLDVIHLEIPPLRDRREDVPPLVHAFLERFAREQGGKPPRLAEETERRLLAYAWPGNVRELRNVIERMVVLAPGDVLTPDLLPPTIAGGAGAGGATAMDDLPFAEAVEAYKRARIVRALADEDGNQTRAAERLGMQRTFLNRLLRELGLRSKDAPADAESTDAG